MKSTNTANQVQLIKEYINVCQESGESINPTISRLLITLYEKMILEAAERKRNLKVSNFKTSQCGGRIKRT